MLGKSWANVNPVVHHEAGWAGKAVLLVHRIDERHVVDAGGRAEETDRFHP